MATCHQHLQLIKLAPKARHVDLARAAASVVSRTRAGTPFSTIVCSASPSSAVANCEVVHEHSLLSIVLGNVTHKHYVLPAGKIGFCLSHYFSLVVATTINGYESDIQLEERRG